MLEEAVIHYLKTKLNGKDGQKINDSTLYPHLHTCVRRCRELEDIFHASSERTKARGCRQPRLVEWQEQRR